MYTNHACILSHNDVLERESNTFCKSMKQAKVNLPTYFFTLKDGVKGKDMVLAATALMEPILVFRYELITFWVIT